MPRRVSTTVTAPAAANNDSTEPTFEPTLRYYRVTQAKWQKDDRGQTVWVNKFFNTKEEAIAHADSLKVDNATGSIIMEKVTDLDHFFETTKDALGETVQVEKVNVLIEKVTWGKNQGWTRKPDARKVMHPKKEYVPSNAPSASDQPVADQNAPF